MGRSRYSEKRRSKIRLKALLALLPPVIVAAGLTLSSPAAPKLPPEATADTILVEKRAHRLTLLRDGMTLKSYPIALSRDTAALAPEGRYIIGSHDPNSPYHRALNISTPDTGTEALAPGAISLHGLHGGLGWLGRTHRWLDWTSGGIAVTNAEIEEIWSAAPDGTAVEILR